MTIDEEREELARALAELIEEQVRINSSLWYRLWHGRAHRRRLAVYDRWAFSWLMRVVRALEIAAHVDTTWLSVEEKKAIAGVLARADRLIVRWRESGLLTGEGAEE